MEIPISVNQTSQIKYNPRMPSKYFPTCKIPKKHTDHSLKNQKTYDDYKEMGIENQ